MEKMKPIKKKMKRSQHFLRRCSKKMKRMRLILQRDRKKFVQFTPKKYLFHPPEHVGYAKIPIFPLLFLLFGYHLTYLYIKTNIGQGGSRTHDQCVISAVL